MKDTEKGFFDAEDFDLQPIPRERSYSPSKRRDVSAHDISDGVDGEGAVGGFKIPPASKTETVSSQYRTARYSGASFESRRRASEPRRQESDAVIREYTPKGPFIRRVTVRSWPNGYNFYEKFVRDALVSHGKVGGPAPHVPYFSYIPQYSQLSSAQWAYYLYMKAQVKEGVCLREADFSYVILYVYEIINLEGVISASEGADLLGRVWALYRRIHPTLDKYMSEWMADYCLIYGVELPPYLRAVIGELAARSSVREFFADEAMAHPEFSPGSMIRLALSDYSPERSRYARTIENFASQTEEVFDAVMREQMAERSGVFDPRIRKSVTVTRDAFCGSLCSSSVKKRIVLELETPFRAPETRRLVTEMMKGAENIVRARLGIKARLSAPALTGRASVITARSEEEREYLSLYESPAEPLTTGRAAEIESESWKNAEILTDGTFDEGDFTEEPAGAISYDGAMDDGADETPAKPCDETTLEAEMAPGSLGEMLKSVDARLCEGLSKAAEGGSFSAYCRSAGLFADDAASRINEMAMDVIGDVVLEGDGTDYVFIEDYREDIE